MWCHIAMLRGINPNFSGLSPTCWKVVYVFRTRLPVAINCIATIMLPLDLHVLSLPLAFILSQDQTLHCKCCLIWLSISNKSEINVWFNFFDAVTFTWFFQLISYYCFQTFKDLYACFASLLFVAGCKGRHIIFIYQTLFKIIKNYFSIS